MSKKKFSEKTLAAVLSAVTLGAGGLIMVGCNQSGGGTVGYIDAPETLQAELGTYVVPEYDVVDKNGMILYGYNVKLKSATDASGNPLEITGSAVTVDVAGIYDFVYTANSDGVSDVTVKIDFADRTAPTINVDDSTLPDFYITGNSYRIPAYTVSGDFVREKCWSKVFHIADDDAKTETEVEVVANRFKAEQTSGAYEIRIHVEDAVGNPNDYKFLRNVDGPENFVENKVLYLDEAFGARQVSVYEPDLYTGEFVSKDTDGAHVYDGENGAYKVSFDGTSETRNSEGLVVMNVPAVVDITDGIELEMYVYNDSESDIIMGSQWWNDTKVEKGKWTRLTWEVDSDGWTSNKSADNKKVIGTVDITGMTIRFLFLDFNESEPYEHKVLPNGDFYLSSMRVIPKEKSQVTAGENVTLGNPDGAYFVGDTVTLSAAEVTGKTFDCFLVDGKPIIGDSFVARNATYSVTAKYIDDALTKDNMTWGVVESYETAGGDAKVYKIGESENWVLSYDLYGIDGSGWNYFGAYIGGNDQLVGIELNGTSVHKAAGYGGTWKGMEAIDLSADVTALLRGATEQDPVTAIYIRQGDTVKLLLKHENTTYFIAAWDHNVFEVSGDSFGIGERTGTPTAVLTNATLKNIKGVSGETRVALFAESLRVNIQKTSVTTDKAEYTLGDTVVLTADAPVGDTAFAYFEVDGKRITGNSFVVTELRDYTAEAIYLAPEKTYKVTVDAFDGHAKITDGKYTLPTASVTDNGGNVKDYAITVEVTDAAGNSYAVTDGKIDISYAGSVRLAITYTAETLDSEYKTKTVYVTVQSGDTLFVPTEKSLGYVKSADTKKNTFEFDGTIKHGNDQGSIKVTTQETDTGFTIEDFDFTGYDFVEFYVYTEGKDVKGGLYWLGDTVLTQNAWTKFVIDLKSEGVYLKDMDGKDFVPNGVHKGQPYTGKLILRVMNNTDKHPVWISSVTAGNWPAATINTDGNVTLDKPSYKVKDTVTLSAPEEKDGKLFLHFTVDGKPIEGNTFTVTETLHTVTAEYVAVSDITVKTDGITTSDGGSRYPQGATVALAFDESKAPAGQIFDYFTVDGARIPAYTFKATANSHEVAAVFKDKAEDLTWTTSTEAPGENNSFSWSIYTFSGNKLGDATHWAIEAKAYGFSTLGSDWYSIDFMVSSTESLHIRLYSAGNAYIRAMGTGLGDGSNILADLDASVIDACKAATETSPVTFTAIRDGNTYYILFNGKPVLVTEYKFAAADNVFGIGGTNCSWLAKNPEMTYKYRTGAAISEYLTSSTVTGTNVTLDKTDGKYKLGDTVSLTPATAESGKLFSHFTVDGEKISCNMFTVTKLNHTVVAVYDDISDITLGDGVITSDGKAQYPRNAKVKLSFDESKLGGKVVDYYLLDDGTENEKRIYNGEFTATAATHTVEAVLVDPAAMTWADGGETYNYEAVMGDAASVLKGRQLTSGEVYGQSEYWAISVDVKHTTEWNSFEFIQGSKQSIRVRFHNGNYCGIILVNENGQENSGNPSGFTDAFPTQDVQLVKKLVAGATVTCVRNGGTISLFVDGYRFFTTTYAVDHTGDWFGLGHARLFDATAAEKDNTGNAPTMNNKKYVTGKDKVEALLASFAASDRAQSENQINHIGVVTKTSDSKTFTSEYVTADIPDGLDEKYVKNGAMKIVATGGNDIGVTADWTFDKDPNNYSELYFYVYIKSDSLQALNHVAGGSYWKDGGNITSTNTWTKVTFDSTLMSQINGSKPEHNDLSKFVFRVYSQSWFTSEGDEFTDITGMTIYITSLYGTPKTGE